MEPKTGEKCDGFEPLGRGRAFTWHGSIDDEYSAGDSLAEKTYGVASRNESTDVNDNGGIRKENTSSVKKPSTRRNAWGCMSYADLITMAIESVPDKRMTLSQIYGWMIQNVPFFHDKGETNSSAGWKNSIRHNLSLHRKFMRVQNEGTGKSSWWMVNKDANTCKSPRRRATSMDNKTYEKKRQRQANLPFGGGIQEKNQSTESVPRSNVVPLTSEVQKLDSFATAFSPIDLRANGRTAPSHGGHLSCIEPIAEVSSDSRVMTQPSSFYWNQCHSMDPPPPYGNSEGLTETVGESLQELFTPDVGVSYEASCSPDHQLTVLQNVHEKYVSPDPVFGTFQDINTTLPSPPSYLVRNQLGSDDVFPQLSPGMCTKEYPPVIQSSESGTYPPSVQYAMNLSHDMPEKHFSDDMTCMQKYYAGPSTTAALSEGTGSNSVLRQILMHNQQASVHHQDFTKTAVEPVSVKAEPVTGDAFTYPNAHSIMISGSNLPDASSSTYVDMKMTNAMAFGSNLDKHMIKVEREVDEDRKTASSCENFVKEGWPFNTGSVLPNSSDRKD